MTNLKMYQPTSWACFGPIKEGVKDVTMIKWWKI